MNNNTIHDPMHGPDEEPGHEHVLEQVLMHLLTRPDLLDVVSEEATIATLVGEDGWPVAVTGVRPAQEELLTDRRGVVVDMSDGSSFAVLIEVVRRATEQTTVVAPSSSNLTSFPFSPAFQLPDRAAPHRVPPGHRMN